MAKGVKFSEGAARRVIAATLAHERGNRDQPPVKFRSVADEDPQSLLGKTTAAWDKGTLATIVIYDLGDPPFEEQSSPLREIEGCCNKFADIEADSWVWLNRGPRGHWYVTAAECPEGS